jgi:hypothetical protein
LKNWTGGHAYYILENGLSMFSTCSEALSEAEFENNGLITLVEEISRHSVCGMATATRFIISIGRRKQSGKIRKTCCCLSRKEGFVKLGPRKVWFLKKLVALKRSQALCIRTIGNMPCGHLRN